MGYRTFRVKSDLLENLKDEISCPASDEGGKKTTCLSCSLCSGTNVKAKNIVINIHGSLKNRFAIAV